METVLSSDDDRDLAGLRILGDIRIGIRGGDQHACHGVAVVSDLVPTFRTTRAGNDVALGELMVTRRAGTPGWTR